MDKSDWGEGPWQDELDELYWRDAATALPCAIIRAGEIGSLCGYVGIPPGHVLFGWEYNDKVRLRPEFLDRRLDQDYGVLDAFCYALSDDQKNQVIPVGMVLHAHGGITWSGHLPNRPSDGYHWFGFDTAHAGDYLPGLSSRLKRYLGKLEWASELEMRSEYRTVDYVKSECERLALQLRALEAETNLVRSNENETARR